MFELDYLHREISKICPINGISQNGDEITILYHEKATELQKKLADDYLGRFKWNDDMEKAEAIKSKSNQYKNDLPMKASFLEYKLKNPSNSFEDFVRYLESVNV